jgi:outer membrane protein
LKNISIALNLILILAVGFLYYKVYSSDEKPVALPMTGSSMPGDAIVFVNSDSLLKGYNLYNDLRKKLENKQDSVDQLLKSRTKSLESEIAAYQSKAETMAPNARMATEEKLMRQRDALVMDENRLMGELQTDESAMSDSVHAHLTGYLREYNKSQNYFFILGYQRGNGILLANDSLDITKKVLEGLNKKK